jgi:DNA adenine methylase
VPPAIIQTHYTTGRRALATNRQRATPFVKWAGGKGQLLSKLRPFFPLRRNYDRYFEPFVGGGAVFFDLAPDNAVLSDRNPELMIAYKMVRDNVHDIIELLQLHSREHRRSPAKHYEKVRSTAPSDLTEVERAARLIYLNKTCYNGLYRVNRDGMFNVPPGRQKNPNICDHRNLLAASQVLRGVQLQTTDFNESLSKAGRDDFIYLDPPYHSKGRTSTFTAYTEDGFTNEDQSELATLFSILDSKGCRVLLSNSDSSRVRDLYSKYMIIPLKASRLITCIPSKRGTKVTELLITNYRTQVNSDATLENC